VLHTDQDWDEVFGVGVCLSSAFSHKDNLIERRLTRLHVPLQFVNGAVARASRADAPVLNDLA
jgi:hypothetical protein